MRAAALMVRWRARGFAPILATGLLLAASPLAASAADGAAPWGTASELAPAYHGEKVVFDVTAGTLAGLNRVLDRAGYLSRMNGDDPLDTRIVIVLHGDAIPFFAVKNYQKYRALMQRAYSASMGQIIEFRMCRAAARLRGLQPRDIHGFITMVPMAEAEIARLQHAGFAYLH
jgi:intracellular sulfur oxidation DsrE/DsrF family protein